MNLDEKTKSRRILIVDDNPAIHSDFQKVLRTKRPVAGELKEIEASLFSDSAAARRTTHFELKFALQGQEGLALEREALRAGEAFQMAFVDMRMPGGWDGIETIIHLWQADPDLQVVICTAYSDYSWESILERLDASDRLVILKKPFDSVEVLQLATALTEKYRLLQEVRRHLTDLEEKVQARTGELRKRDEQFRLITENAADLIGIIDARGTLLYCSPSHERLLGYPQEELMTSAAFAHVHPQELEMVRAGVKNTIETGVRNVLEYRIQHQNGSWWNLEAHVAPFRNAEGRVDGVLIVARDISKRKRAEEVNQIMEVQLRQAQKLEAVGQLAAGIAHEINTPTQYVGDNTRFLKDSFESITEVLQAYEDLLDAAKNNAVTPKMIAGIEKKLEVSDLGYLFEQIPVAIRETLEGVERITKIVRAMKEFSHPGSAEKTAVDLNKAIETTTTVARNEWKYVADLELDFDAKLPPVPCFVGEFNQCILNLVVNAAHAIGDVVRQRPGTRGKITVQTRLQGDDVEIRVRDTGTGIPEEYQPRIFEPFFTTKGVGKGTGQGLSIVYGSIVKKHGGAISFETEEGRGTVFILRLPITPRPIPGESRSESQAAEQKHTT